ncbi:MAG: hypothetical protein IKW46_07590 [Bacteroidaceae bacterium]|nr:hypothetical protein [Bacteroidaceae bacterium]
MAKSIIQRQPTADVVEVVRCKDCVHAGYPEDKIVWCLKHKKYMPKYGYCNYGKEQDDG